MNVNDSIFRALEILNVAARAFIPQKHMNAKCMIYNLFWYLWIETIRFDKVLSDYKGYIFCKVTQLFAK